MTKSAAYLKRKIDWVHKWLGAFFSALASLFGLLWEKDFPDYVLKQWPARTGLHDLLNNYLPTAFIVCFSLAAFCSFIGLFTKKTIHRLEAELHNEREKLNLIANNVETLVNGLLLRLSEKIGFARGEHSRLTLYIHNKNGHFISFGRYTPDPTYAGKGRNLLPDNAGCISQAWKADWCYEGDLAYKKARQQYDLTKEVYAEMRMKSKFYAVKRIDASGTKQPIAVLVFESTMINRFPEAQIKTTLEAEEAYLAEVIGCLKDHIPDPQEAAAKGF